MKHILIVITTFFIVEFVQAVPVKDWKVVTENPAFLHRSIKKMTDVMVHDIYSPPVASRIYAYITIAGYEAAINSNKNYNSFTGKLNELQPFPFVTDSKIYSPALAAVHAILTVGKSMVISEKEVEKFHTNILAEFKSSGMPEVAYKNSLDHGKKVAEYIAAWAAKDNYQQTRSFAKHSIGEEEGTWKPTPPAYLKAVEPNWNKIRPFIIDSAQQFKPLPPNPFSIDKASRFYKEAAEVYEIGLKLTTQQREIADFWDCNPFRMNVRGHVMFATKKISPGGHWINITGLACNKANADLAKTAEAYASVSIAIADAFISCWDEKYRSNVIRPETYINDYIDGQWTPMLQTPPFPEYTSGHSVISTASAVILTRLFGDNFSFDDSSEIEFGLPTRHFISFKAAANEAALSRWYGGIHYITSINNGVTEGTDIGKFVASKLQMQKNFE